MLLWLGDRRIIRLIAKWLTAGVLEDGHLIETEEGTPQGAVISPLLANIYLHYVYDQWVHQWRQRCATGYVIVGARCVSSARRVLCGGRRVISVPTATAHRAASKCHRVVRRHKFARHLGRTSSSIRSDLVFGTHRRLVAKSRRVC
jgi:retron-type reverse transcriptase